MTETKTKTQPVPTQTAFGATQERSLTPYREAGVGAADRTHIEEQGEQRARRNLGLGSLVVALGSLGAIPFALQESLFTAGLAATIGAGFAALAAMTLKAYSREKDASVALYDRELVIVAGRRRDVVSWDSIVEVRADYRASEDATLSALAVTSLVLVDGRRVEIPRAVSGAGALAHEVLKRTKDPLSTATREVLERNELVPLGALALTPQGIFAGNYLWRWFSQPQVRIEGPFLHIFSLLDPTPPSTVLIEDVANLHVVLDLVARGYAPAPRAPSPPVADPLNETGSPLVGGAAPSDTDPSKPQDPSEKER